MALKKTMSERIVSWKPRQLQRQLRVAGELTIHLQLRGVHGQAARLVGVPEDLILRVNRRTSTRHSRLPQNPQGRVESHLVMLSLHLHLLEHSLLLHD